MIKFQMLIMNYKIPITTTHLKITHTYIYGPSLFEEIRKYYYIMTKIEGTIRENKKYLIEKLNYC